MSGRYFHCYYYYYRCVRVCSGVLSVSSVSVMFKYIDCGSFSFLACVRLTSISIYKRLIITYTIV